MVFAEPQTLYQAASLVLQTSWRKGYLELVRALSNAARDLPRPDRLDALERVGVAARETAYTLRRRVFAARALQLARIQFELHPTDVFRVPFPALVRYVLTPVSGEPVSVLQRQLDDLPHPSETNRALLLSLRAVTGHALANPDAFESFNQALQGLCRAQFEYDGSEDIRLRTRAIPTPSNAAPPQ